MAEVYATKTGNWSDTTVWNTGALPAGADDVYANGKTVTIDQDVSVQSLRNTAGTTAVAGGGFTASASRTVAAAGAGLVTGSATCLTWSGASPAALTLTAAVTAGAGNALAVSGSGPVTITGTVTSGASGAGVFNTAGANVTVNGDLVSGGGNGAIYSGGTLTVNGDVLSTSGVGAYMIGAANLVVNGDVVAGNSTGVNYSGTGAITVNGSVTAGSAASAHGISGGNTVTVTGDVTASAYANGVLGSSFTKVLAGGSLYAGSGGRVAVVAGTVLVNGAATVTETYRANSSGSAGAEVTLTSGAGGGGGAVLGSSILTSTGAGGSDMGYKTGDVVAADFCVQTPATGAATDADSAPSAVLVLNGVDDAAAVTVTHKATGVYGASVTLPAVTDGDTLQLRASAAVGGVTGAAVVWAGQGTTAFPSDPATLADGSISEDTFTTPSESAGRPAGVLGMLRRLFEWGSNKRTRDRATGTVSLRNVADDGTLETQTQTTTGLVDAQTKGV